MSYERLERTLKMNRKQFKRRTGVYPETFAEMKAVLTQREGQKKKWGRPAALSTAEQLLLTLEFWREYRTFAHLGDDWGVHETTVQRTVKRVETALIASEQFRLLGKKALKDTGTVSNIIAVDASEVPCERPKKSGQAPRGAVLPKTAAPLVQRQEEAPHPEAASAGQRGDAHDHERRHHLWCHARPDALSSLQGAAAPGDGVNWRCWVSRRLEEPSSRHHTPQGDPPQAAHRRAAPRQPCAGASPGTCRARHSSPEDFSCPQRCLSAPQTPLLASFASHRCRLQPHPRSR